MTDEIKQLAEQQRKLNYNNTGMKPIKTEDRFGFFPYGTGTFGCDFPRRGIMILGQDFGNKDYVDKLEGKGESMTKSVTWRNLLVLLNKGGVEFTDCFFTNAIMGMREEGEKMTGNAPPFNSKKHPRGPEFLKECFSFFEEQVSQQKPSLIVCLGKSVYSFLKAGGIQPLESFPDNSSYEKIPPKFFYIKSVDVRDHKANLCLVVHPSTPNRTNNRTVAEDAKTIKLALHKLAASG